MPKRRRSLRPLDHSYSEQQLAGLRAHAHAQKQSTVERLRSAITSLQAQHQPISARTIYGECGLSYASFRRNPEALLLYQQHSTFLKRKRKRTRAACPDTVSPRDPLLAYKKPDLVARLRQEQVHCVELKTQHAAILSDYVQKDVKIAELEAELARYREYFEGLRLQVQPQEHGK
jgi:hypothetical protein